MNHPSPVAQYRESIKWLHTTPLVTSWPRYDRAKRLAELLYSMFKEEDWKELDEYLSKLHPDTEVPFSEIPVWGVTSYEQKNQTPRFTTFLLIVLEQFRLYMIEDYLSKNKSSVEDITINERWLLLGWWINACETGRHMFWEFSSPGRWNPLSENLDVYEIRKAMFAAAMFDTPTFNRHSPRDYHHNKETWSLRHTSDDGVFTPWERIGCLAAQRFPGVTPEKTIFDELFTRICHIYGYTWPQNRVVARIENTLCPFHHTESSR